MEVGKADRSPVVPDGEQPGPRSRPGVLKPVQRSRTKRTERRSQHCLTALPNLTNLIRHTRREGTRELVLGSALSRGLAGC